MDFGLLQRAKAHHGNIDENARFLPARDGYAGQHPMNAARKPPQEGAGIIRIYGLADDVVIDLPRGADSKHRTRGKAARGQGTRHVWPWRSPDAARRLWPPRQSAAFLLFSVIRASVLVVRMVFQEASRRDKAVRRAADARGHAAG
jgi:hypothetical protein